MHPLLTATKENFKSMDFDVDFQLFQSLQGLKMCNEQVLNTMSESNKNMWFLSLSKHLLMPHMMQDHKVTTVPSIASNSAPKRACGMIRFKQGKVGSSSAIEFGNAQHWKTSAGSCTDSWKCNWTNDILHHNNGFCSICCSVIPAPTAATTTLAVTIVVAPVAAAATMHATSCAMEFDKGESRSFRDHRKFQNREQWLKWHCALMGSACEHKCEKDTKNLAHRIKPQTQNKRSQIWN